MRKSSTIGKANVVNDPLIDRNKTILSSHRIKLGRKQSKRQRRRTIQGSQIQRSGRPETESGDTSPARLTGPYFSAGGRPRRPTRRRLINQIDLSRRRSPFAPRSGSGALSRARPICRYPDDVCGLDSVLCVP
ncbi:hypothetical protein EVAR_87091_1 [Eumeta japonica]|uniref:Uncharacterized protein n=1 Tax=Eumeta variegata TaxID=151549 RepID=A0A4C1VNZ7_EUMVA|nr:hypothetical protein EVAR_87091_1 [Eumeta japonica]